MTHTVSLWIGCTYQPALRTGGWAHICIADGKVTGSAGGDRRISTLRTSLAALTAALRSAGAAKPGDSIVIHTTDVEVAGFVQHLSTLATGAASPPTEDLDLWAQLQTATAGRRLKVVKLRPEPQSPQAFVAAWAELGRDKAKAAGPFTAAIPKTNLAKIAGLPLDLV